jgi:hypothetical protein
LEKYELKRVKINWNFNGEVLGTSEKLNSALISEMMEFVVINSPLYEKPDYTYSRVIHNRKDGYVRFINEYMLERRNQ